MKNDKPLIGISSCLLGNKVRYDSGHKQDRYIIETLGQFAEFYPVCPEVECGMPIPREAMRLEQHGDAIRLMTNKTAIDKTDQMQEWTRNKIPELKALKLCGFIFKAKSPSSGLHRVKVYHKGIPQNIGRGIFAQAVTDSMPLLPVEDEGRLHDPQLRENFIERVFIIKRWYELIGESKHISKLQQFHAEHKYILMAHSPSKQKKLGALLAANDYQIESLYEDYFSLFSDALNEIADVKKNTNVLQHLKGYFRMNLTKEEGLELQEVIDNYHSRLVPLIVPITLLNHYVRKYEQEYLMNQFYLHPHPMELMLRNHV